MSLIAVAAVAVYLAAAMLASAEGPNEQALLKIDSILGVDNGPTAPTEFKVSKSYKILRIMNYHWNYGKGAPGGKIGLVSSDGKKIGSWSVTTTPGQGGVPNAYWYATPNVVIPPGTYRVTDSSPGTWAQNEETGGRGISHVFGSTNPAVIGVAPSEDNPTGTTLATTTTLKPAEEEPSQSENADENQGGEGDGAISFLSLPVMGGLAALLLGLLAAAHLGCKKIKADNKAKAESGEAEKEVPGDEPEEGAEGEEPEEEEQEDEHPVVSLELTYPVGRSPKVFTSGWVFGARCTVDAGKPSERDVSDTVEWSGSGDFEPALGSRSRPVFGAEGSNTITLEVTVDGERTERTFTVDAVSPERYATTGTKVICPADSHGCLTCPHTVEGYVVAGSPNVFIDGLPAARQGDAGTHVACCGPGTFTVTGGDSEVLIDGRPAARHGDETTHCGGVGSFVP